MYTNKFSQCFRQLTITDIEAVEKRIGFELPAQLKEHYLYCNGGTPERRCWKKEGWDYTCLNFFFPMRPANASDEEMVDEETVDEIVVDLLSGAHIPPTFIPFADDAGGNYFCVDRDTGNIYFFAMDLGDDLENGRRYITSSLFEFIEGLDEAKELEYL